MDQRKGKTGRPFTSQTVSERTSVPSTLFSSPPELGECPSEYSLSLLWMVSQGVESPTAKLIHTSVQHQFSNLTSHSPSARDLSYGNSHNKLTSNGRLYRCLKFTFIFLEFILCCYQDDSSVQSLSRVRLFATPWTAARQASLSITNSQSLHKLMSIESVMPTNHLILCRPLLPPPSIFPSIRVFSNESALYIRWPKYWSFSFNISPSNEHPGLISREMQIIIK